MPTENRTTRIETRPISSLKLWDKNPRSIKKDRFEELKKSIKELGFNDVLKITEDGTVIGGNMRLRALNELGWTEVPVVVTKAATDAEILRVALRDNEEFGYYEQEQVAELALAYLDPLELETFELHLGTPTKLNLVVDKFGPEPVEDEPPEVDEDNVVSKLGEIYQLGRHRVMCGDSTIDLPELLGNKKPTMVFTDPPYGVDYQSRVDEERRKGWGKIENDDLQGEVLQDFLTTVVDQTSDPRYVCCNWQSYIDFEAALGKPNALIVWDKGSIGLGAGYRNQHEFILFYGKLDHNSESNVWSIYRDNTGGYSHPTQKPVAIPLRAIKNSSKPNDIVLDYFLGSGSTLIACEQTDRICYGMELDPKYVDVIRKRYAKYINPEEWEDKWQEMTPSIPVAVPQ